jgi:hypothetical protein
VYSYKLITNNNSTKEDEDIEIKLQNLAETAKKKKLHQKYTRI